LIDALKQQDGNMAAEALPQRASLREGPSSISEPHGHVILEPANQEHRTRDGRIEGHSVLSKK